ncbi:MAG: right-handed parallel beta-helix repeat-containing protein, partial [Planctomycetia bacterium]|nr:right-handed parallel beta-helix repeat-containing protein [Planctomycetia bacterium]
EEKGIITGEKGHGHFQDCMISQTKGTNVVSAYEGDVTLIRCLISDGQKSGVVVDEGGNGTFHGNTLVNNLMNGSKMNWYITSTAHVTGSNNTPSLYRVTENGFIPVPENE